MISLQEREPIQTLDSKAESDSAIQCNACKIIQIIAAPCDGKHLTTQRKKTSTQMVCAHTKRELQ